MERDNPRRIAVGEGPYRLDLGCGNNCLPGHIGADYHDYGQAIVWDLEEGIPLPDGTVEAIHSSHFFEHIREDRLSQVWREIVRVCQHEADVTIIVPHANEYEAYYATHVSFWTEQKMKGLAHGTECNSDRIMLLRTERRGIELVGYFKVLKS
jgi:predicted SAM-dependent methyltransferase